MPEMDGYEVCAYLKAQPHTRHIPIIFISSLDTAADKVKAFKAGAADYIPRPFQLEEVLLRVRNQLMLRSLQRQLKSANQKLAHANQELAHSNQALSQANDKLESTYQTLAQLNQELTDSNHQLFQRNREMSRSNENLMRLNDKLERQIERRSAALNQLSEACASFVPHSLVRLLERQKLVQIQAGDYSKAPLSVLFLKTPGFTQIAEHRSPHEYFLFLNSWLGHVNPLVTQYEGFVEHYAADSLLAVFPERAEDALQAALALQKMLNREATHFFQEFDIKKENLNLNISLHFSQAMLGMVGDQQRMQSLLHIEQVNFLQRLEAVGRHYGTQIVCTNVFFQQIEQHQRYAHRYLGCIRLKTLTDALDFFEVLSESDLSKHNKLEAKERFEDAVHDYQHKDFSAAMQKWHNILERNPNDQAARHYLQQAEQLQKALPADWLSCH